MALVISVEPAEEPLNLEEAKAHLRVDIEDDDGIILDLIKVSRQYAETVTGRALVTQTWKYYIDDFPVKDYIELPKPKLQSVSSFKYTDYNLTVTTLVENTDYIVDTNSEPGRVVLAYGKTWPTTTLHVTSPIEIIFICGYGTPDDVEQSIKQGMKIDISDMYENRESIIIGQPIAHLDVVDRIYMPYRIWNF